MSCLEQIQEVHHRTISTEFDTEPATRCADTMRGTLESFAWASTAMIPVIRPRQPREEEMKCGNQPADTRVIHRRSHCPARRVARSVGTLIPTHPSHVRGLARMTRAHT